MEVITRAEARLHGLKRYFTGKPCKHGHIDERTVSNGSCLQCARIKTDREKESRGDYFRAKRKEYYIANRGAELEYGRAYRDKNRSTINEKAMAYREKNRVDLNRKMREYAKNNKSKMARLREDWRKRNPMNAEVRRPLQRLLEGVALHKFEPIIGYTRKQLVDHIEGLFQDGMTWDNRGDWHVDHILSVSSMLKNGVDDIAVINALENLQPLWAADNVRKGSIC